MSHKHSSNDTVPLRIALLGLWLMLVAQSIYSNFRQPALPNKHDQVQTLNGQEVRHQGSKSWLSGSLLLFAEAGKKKKEKSEVVVISVNNPKGMGHMYPVYVPSCGHSGGFGRRR